VWPQRLALCREVTEAFARLAQGRERDNVLLSLKDLVWSWARRPIAAAARSLHTAAA
jgi:hypothetical protein